MGDEKIKSIGIFVLSFSLLVLGLAIIYIGWEIHQVRKGLPEILMLTGETADKITPAIANISEISKLVPPILEEVAATRKTVDKTVEEVKNTREQIPGILKDIEPITRQIENTTRELPKTIGPVIDEVGKTRELVPDILEEIRNTNASVEKAATEIEKTRVALPGLLDRADQIVASAGNVGKEASKGAVTGIVGGIFSMPFSIVGGIGKGAVSLLGEEDQKHLTEEDIQMMESSVLDIAEKGDLGQSKTWKNKKSGNGGENTLIKKYEQEGKICRQVKIEISINGGKPKTTLVSGCKQADGTWIATEGRLPRE